MTDTQFATNVSDAATTTYASYDFPKRLFDEIAQKFENRSDRILWTRAVRNSDITVPLADSMISDKEISFVAYVSPERRSIESHIRQSLSANVPVCRRIRLGESDDDVKKNDIAEAFAESLKKEIIAFDPLIGKLVEDGEVAVVLQYELDYLLATPLPNDVISEDEWAALADEEQADWTRFELSNGRTSYRRYKAAYWRDSEGRRASDRHYRELLPNGTRRQFKRDAAATRKAWKTHQKAIAQGKIPLRVRLIPALDCAPILMRGTGNRRWECVGLAIRSKFEENDLIAQGIWWNTAQGQMSQLGFDTPRVKGKTVDFYEAHIYLLNEETQEMDPCILYCVDGRSTWYSTADGTQDAAMINLREEYGLDQLPVNYFWGAHTEDDDPDMYGFPVMEPLTYTILNREGMRTNFQAHLRKYAFSKLAITPDPKIEASTYTNVDGSLRDIDMDAEVVMLPGPVAPMVQPLPPTSVLAMDNMYTQDLAGNTPSDPILGGGGSNASGHSLTIQKANFNAANSHVLEGARECVEWVITTAITMLAALEDRFGIQASIFPHDEIPTGGQKRKDKSVLTFDSRWFDNNFRILAEYPNVGNLAEVQQTMDLYERGGASFEDLCTVRGKSSPMEERIKIMLDKWWNSPPGLQTLFLEVLKRRGSLEQAALLEAQLNKEVQPNGLPTAAIPPELQAIASQMGVGGAGAAGNPSLGAMPGSPGQEQGQVGGVQLPNLAGSALGGAVSGGMGTAQLLADARATAGIPATPPV